LVCRLQKQQEFELITNIQLNEFGSLICNEAQLSIFRIVQEQVNNIIKYAKAKHVLFSILIDKQEIHLQISDDGVGFDPNQAKKGLGVNNIISRIKQLNGKYSLNSAPSKGCNWDIYIPLMPPVICNYNLAFFNK
jgi:two-component system, NarL family, sensor histidine kinase UhpB